jgi:hypothetical protein
MEKRYRILARTILKESIFRFKTDFAQRVIVDLIENIAGRALRCRVRTTSQILGPSD